MVDEETTPAPAPAEEPVIPPPEATPAPTEPEVVTNDPVAETPPAEPQTAQMGRSEPLPVESEPLSPEPAGQATKSSDSGQTTKSADSPAPAQNSAPISTTVQHLGRDVLVKARAMIQARKKNKLEKIMEALNTNDPTTLKLRRAGEITNDEVEKLLHVSDATATRYLSALEKEGKIKQVGKTGIGVVYTKV